MTPQERQTYERLLREGLWFGGLPEALQRSILDRSTVRTYPRGSTIQLEESEPEALCAVLEGQVAIGRWASPEHEVLIYVGSPGFWFGEAALLSSIKTIVSAWAHTSARVLAFPRAAFDRLVEEDPQNYRRFARLALDRYQVCLRSEVESRAFAASDLLLGRLASLAEMRHQDHPHEAVVELELTQADVAALTGLSRQTVNAGLRQLAERGLIELGFRKIRIPALEGLRDQLGAARRRGEHDESWAAAFRYG